RDAALLAQLEDREDVRVLQARGGLGLDLEALPALGVERPFDRQGLDRDLALEPLVVRPVHHAHAAPPDAAGHGVASDAASRTARGLARRDHWAHSWNWISTT